MTSGRATVDRLRGRGLRVGLVDRAGAPCPTLGPRERVTDADRAELAADRSAVVVALVAELPLEAFARSRFALDVNAPDLGGWVRFRGDDHPAQDDRPSYTAGELRTLMGASPAVWRTVATIKATIGPAAVVEPPEGVEPVSGLPGADMAGKRSRAA